MAVGATATNGCGQSRGRFVGNARTATMIAAAALDPTSRHSSPAHAPPPRPMRSSQTNVSSAPGGWPETWVIHESGWKSRILREKLRSACGDVGDGRHLAQVLVTGGEPAREAALPAVDHGQRERPHARRRPRRQRQGSPRQPLRDGRPPQHRSDADEDRGQRAPPDVGVPPAEDRGGVGEKVETLGVGPDQRGDDAQVQVRNHERRHHQDDGDGDRHRLPAAYLQFAHDRQGRGRPGGGVSWVA